MAVPTDTFIKEAGLLGKLYSLYDTKSSVVPQHVYVDQLYQSLVLYRLWGGGLGLKEGGEDCCSILTWFEK